ncbi:hypothetical protein [Paenibacillus ihumii]|uniref:hypothetical protein n=1 Tax=Paenibacillus ihumii TaxID=687436 RepID=UPI001E4E11D5|nr:hypothetical protein [Paenibacillus ihumii]
MDGLQKTVKAADKAKDINKLLEAQKSFMDLLPFTILRTDTGHQMIVPKDFSRNLQKHDGPDMGGSGGRLERTPKAGPIKEVEIVDHTGKPIGELDEIDLKNGIFYEDKAAKGLDIINPKTGLPAQTPQQFTDKQILDKTRKRINNIAEATATRATKNGIPDVPSLDQIKGIRKFVFRLDGDTPELRQAVENSLEQLRKEFPDYTFEVWFGGEK